MEPLEIKAQTDELAGKETSRDKFNNFVAIAVVTCAVFMAVSKVKDDNIVQAMQQAQADKIDQWNFYQAKSLKQHMFEIQVQQAELQQKVSGPTMSAAGKAALAEQIGKWKASVAKYEKEKDEPKKAAEDATKLYDKLNYRDDQFDISDALLGLAVALFALSSLTRNKWVFGFATGSAVFGIIMGLAGFLQWGIHPGTLVKFLS